MLDTPLLSPRELWRGATILTPILCSLFIGSNQFDHRQTEAAYKQDGQIQEIKTMHDEISVISAEGKANHDELIRLIVYFHVPQAGAPYTTCPPYCGNVGKLRQPRPMPPETQAPAVGAMKGHALFVPEPVAHTEPPQNAGDFDDVVRIQQEAWK